MGHDSDLLFQDGTYNPFPNFPYTGTLRPVYPLSPKRVVPDHIKKPDYANDGEGHIFETLTLFKLIGSAREFDERDT